MKNNNKEINMLHLFAFIALIAVAVTQILSVFSHFNILTLQGLLVSIIDTVKNICICIVIGVCGYKFVNGKSKGLKITYWVSLAIFIVCSVLVLF